MSNGFDRLLPGRKFVNEIISDGVAQRTGVTGWTARFGVARYNSWATPCPPSTSARVLAASAANSSATRTITTGLTNPDYPRAVRVAPSTSTLATGNVVVNGTDQFGATVSDTIALAGTGATVDGVVTFKTITSVVLPAISSAGTNVTIGLTNIFGLDRQPSSVASVIRGAVNGTPEATAPLLGVPSSSNASALASPTRASAKFNTAATSSAGALVEIFYIPQDTLHA